MFKVAVLVLVAGAGLSLVDWSRFSPGLWPPLTQVAAGGMLIFLAYEGFELIANAARDVEDPRVLPRAFYASVASVTAIYILVATVAWGVLSPEQVARYRDYALAVAAEPSLGELGFILVGLAALASTASAINATLYGTARISYQVARYGQLPPTVGRPAWGAAPEGLLPIALLSLALAVLGGLEQISTAGSGGFLLVFTAVNLAAYRLREEAKVNPALALTAAAATSTALAILVHHVATTNPDQLTILAAMTAASFTLEAAYRRATGRRLARYIDPTLRLREENIRRWEHWVPKLAEELRKLLRDAEVYLVGSVARGELHRAHDVDLLVATPSPPRGKEARRIAEEAKKRAGLTRLHPADIHFATPDKKEHWLKQSRKAKKIA